MKKRILSVILALCFSISSQSMVYAWQEESFQQENPLMEEDARLTARSSGSLAPAEVYEAMIALKDQDAYKEGTTWTNNEPYSGSNGYYWKGGNIDGKRIHAVGCVAFAFILSDAAFGSLPARMYASGGFSFENIKVGDILRLNNDAHTVIVLDVIDAGVVVAEGNISTGDHKGKVHWGRTISREEVMRNTSHYITRYPEGYVPPNDPSANTIIGTGNFGEGFTWSLTKAGTVTISGRGAMPDFDSAEQQPWVKHSSQIRKVIIQNGITSIGSCAFWNCGVLSVEIPVGVTTIGNSAFRQSSIISVTLPSSVKTIGDSAFRQCQNLSSVSISEGVETIGQNAFSACMSLTSIALPASVREVGSAAFFQCQEMTSAVFAPGSGQVKLGDNLFTQCYDLTNVTLPRNIDRIGDGMFQNCICLAGVEIPKGAESIGFQAFASCSRLTTVIIPDSVRTIGSAAFSACPLKDIYFTGTEAQWKNINKMGDTGTAVSKAAIHYNYVPPSPPDPDTGDDSNDNSSGDHPGNNDNSESRVDLSKGTVTLAKTSYPYDGKPKTPSVTVKLDGKTLVLNTDYTVSYSNNIKVGTAKAIVTGKGKYTGSKTVQFTITKAADQNPAESITCKKTVYKVAYGTKPFKINASSKSKMTFTSSKPKIASVDKKTGKVTIRNTGVATITIKAGKASKKVTVKVSPKKQSVKSIKAGKGRKLTVKWAKDKMASKYQVQVSTDKKFKKSVKSKSLSKTSYTFTKLKKGKKYYVRVRSYKKYGKETLYGTWSKVKLSGKVKK
ncbi:MAG: leucine-rich repeat protein [Lachnospiraceae bacterium]|nr:leucine-rich repeat protein [Lachnospiraceae bacterium]